jgi:NAD(P)-dependent dehydrogenase (short-subunit alcohol dehydrogenase family)
VITDKLFRLDGRVVSVIGAGSGIGEAVAHGAATHGARVACLDVNADLAEATAEAIRASGGDASGGALDIRRSGDVDSALATIAGRHGRLDAVVCTPGINVRKPILRYTDEELDRVLDLNIKGTFHVLRAAGKVMSGIGHGGSIVLFSSIRSQVVEPGQAVYAGTKAAIVQMARAAAAEFGPFGIRVNTIGPGVVETPLTAPIKADAEWYGAYAAKTIVKRWASADEMVGPTLFLLSDAASYVTGTLLMADGGWTAADGRFEPHFA